MDVEVLSEFEKHLLESPVTLSHTAASVFKVSMMSARAMCSRAPLTAPLAPAYRIWLILVYTVLLLVAWVC